MGNEVKIPRMTLRYNGLFDFDGMYAAVIDWAKHYGYMWQEKSYKHKVPSPTGAEQEFDWEMNIKVTDYIEYRIWFTIHMWDLTEVEVEVNGKKKSLSNARIYIVIDGFILYDWQDKFGGNKFAKKLGEWYNKLINPIEQQYFDQLYYRMWNLHAVLKKYFDMQSQKYVYKGYLGEG